MRAAGELCKWYRTAIGEQKEKYERTGGALIGELFVQLIGDLYMRTKGQQMVREG